MITRSIDTNGDWNFGNGKGDYLEENTALTQNIKTRLKSFLGDCFFDTEAGVDWFNFLGSKNLSGLKLAVGGVIINTVGVIELIDLSFSLDENRRFELKYSVSSSWSTTVNGVTVL